MRHMPPIPHRARIPSAVSTSPAPRRCPSGRPTRRSLPQRCRWCVAHSLCGHAPSAPQQPPARLHAGPLPLVSVLATTAAVTTAAEAPAATRRSPGPPSLKKQTGSGGRGEGPGSLWPLPPPSMSDLEAAPQPGQVLPRRHPCPLNSMCSAEGGGTRRQAAGQARHAAGVAERGWEWRLGGGTRQAVPPLWRIAAGSGGRGASSATAATLPSQLLSTPPPPPSAVHARHIVRG